MKNVKNRTAGSKRNRNCLQQKLLSGWYGDPPRLIQTLHAALPSNNRQDDWIEHPWAAKPTEKPRPGMEP